jgi:thermolysin
MKQATAAVVAVVTTIFVFSGGSSAQQSSVLQIQATSTLDLRVWDTYLTRGARAGQLRLRAVDRDPSLTSRTVERFQQFHEGVRIWGAEVVRDSERGVPLSIFGVLSRELALSVEPSLAPDIARESLARIGGTESAMLTEVELVIVPLDNGEHRLAYTAVVAGGGDVVRVFVDAHTGAELLRYREIRTQAAVGSGRGVLGDLKKLSVLRQTGAYTTDDQHRPPVLRTYDLRNTLARAINVVTRGGLLFPSDLATDVDNEWTDASAVDAHVHVGWTYDYFFKRFGRRGLDDRDRPIVTLINGVSPQGALGLSGPEFGVFAVNAFWCDVCGPGRIGLLYFGNGIPPGFSLDGQNYGPFAGSLDVAAHELTHGVVASSSALIGFGESGALDEAFADIMGTSVEFFYQTPGAGRGQADYLIAEDTIRAVLPGALDGIRSMSDPRRFGDPDHYSNRYTGTDDQGGIHINAGIVTHAFYLAIEGGTHRTSGVTVQGVGAVNRDQIEKVFYRTFVFLLPANAGFSTARAATVRAAQDLYGAGGAVERTVTQAWTAVGVF